MRSLVAIKGSVILETIPRGGEEAARALSSMQTNAFPEGTTMDAPSASVATMSELTCPLCNHVSLEHMPEDACRFFFTCSSCGNLLKPKSGDCCVFCSYGSIPCPPIQCARDSASQ